MNKFTRLPFASALAIGLFSSGMASAANSVIRASETSQQEVLTLINNLAQSRTAGRDLLEADLRAKTGFRGQNLVEGRSSLGDTSVGPVKISSSLSLPDVHNTDLVMRFSGACVDREYVREKLQLRDVAWASPPDDPSPTLGYAYFSGGSAVTLFFDASGTKCLTAVRMEPEATMQDQLQKSRK